MTDDVAARVRGTGALAGPTIMSPELERLTRWEASGGLWQVTSRSTSHLTLALLSCDGGAEMDRLVSDDPGLFALVAGRSASDE